eukprot:13785410-Alexandrium_andersonii.AAC.1
MPPPPMPPGSPERPDPAAAPSSEDDRPDPRESIREMPEARRSPGRAPDSSLLVAAPADATDAS